MLAEEKEYHTYDDAKTNAPQGDNEIETEVQSNTWQHISGRLCVPLQQASATFLITGQHKEWSPLCTPAKHLKAHHCTLNMIYDICD